MSSSLYPGRCMLWMPFQAPWTAAASRRPHCCEAMGHALDFDCDQHADPWECSDCLVIYNPVFDEYGIVMRDGTVSYVLIAHCPWCGTPLPESQRDRWFNVLDAQGIDTTGDVPAHYLSDAWRRM